MRYPLKLSYCVICVDVTVFAAQIADALLQRFLFCKIKTRSARRCENDQESVLVAVERTLRSHNNLMLTKTTPCMLTIELTTPCMLSTEYLQNIKAATSLYNVALVQYGKPCRITDRRGCINARAGPWHRQRLHYTSTKDPDLIPGA